MLNIAIDAGVSSVDYIYWIRIIISGQIMSVWDKRYIYIAASLYFNLIKFLLAKFNVLKKKHVEQTN